MALFTRRVLGDARDDVGLGGADLGKVSQGGDEIHLLADRHPTR
jgi:hypothetical protein